MTKKKLMKALFAKEKRMYKRIVKSHEYDQLMKTQILIMLEGKKPKHDLFVDPNHKFYEFDE